MLDTFARCASGRSTSSGRNARDMCTVPIRFTSSTRRIAASSSSATGTNGWITPALLSSPSTAPCAATTAAGSASTAGWSVMSTTWVDSRSPAAASRAVSSSPPALTSTAATRAPLLSIRRVSSLPIPPPAPVTTQTLPRICMG